MWALRAWSMMSTGTSSLCARFHSKLRTLWAITPSLSSSAKRRISSNSFSRCFLLALVQLAYRSWGGVTVVSVEQLHCSTIQLKANEKYTYKYTTNIQQKSFIACNYWGQVLLTLKQSKRWSSCSGEKSHASLANRSWTFLTMASCLPACRHTQNSSAVRVTIFIFYQKLCDKGFTLAIIKTLQKVYSNLLV